MRKLRRYKSSDDYSYVIGVYPALQLLKYRPERVFQIFLSEDYERNEGAIKLAKLARKHGVTIEVNGYLLRKFAEVDSAHAVAFFYKYSESLEETAQHVVLVNPSDMGNMGTVIRTMVGMGFNNLGIVKPAVDIFAPKVLRASMGEVFQIKAQYFVNFEDYLARYVRQQYLFMLHPTSIDIEKLLPLKAGGEIFSLVFGGEGPGLPASFAQFGTPVKIKQSAEIDSLNLSIAVGIGLYRFHQLK